MTTLLNRINEAAYKTDDHRVRRAVCYYVDEGAKNANLTVITERAAPPSDWEYLFRDSIGLLLAQPHTVGSVAEDTLKFFAAFNIRP